MEKQPHVIIHGNPVDGFEYVGPFPDAATAAEFGNTDSHLDGDWWIAPLHAPDVESSIEPIGAIAPDGTRIDQWDERLRAAGCSPIYRGE